MVNVKYKLYCKFNFKKRKVKIPKRPGNLIYMGQYIKSKKNIGMETNITIDDGVNELISNINYWKNAPIWNKKLKKRQKIGLNIYHNRRFLLNKKFLNIKS